MITKTEVYADPDFLMPEEQTIYVCAICGGGLLQDKNPKLAICLECGEEHEMGYIEELKLLTFLPTINKEDL